jgi:hypothetical protein
MKNKIDPAWVSWAENQVRFLKDGGYVIFPDDGAIFQLNKNSQTITLVCCVPSWIGSDTETINRQVFAKIQYRYERPAEVPTSPDAIIDKIFNNLQKYASDIPTLLHGIGVIYRLKRENDSQNDKVLELITRKGKKLPINPVTIRGEGNFTVGRLWIGVDSVPDTAHRFNPAVQRGPRWDKPVTILLWKEGQSLNVDDPNRPAMIVDEPDFIQFVNSLNDSLSAYVKLWGQADRVNEHQKMFALFDKREEGSRLEVRLYKSSDDYTEQTLVGEAVLDSNKFFDGLGHLFPNGELS